MRLDCISTLLEGADKMAYNLRSRPRIAAEPKEEATEEEVNIMSLRSPQEKALANEYILKEIFGYLPVEDLVECRLVNKVWDDVATRVIAPKAPIVKFWNFHSIKSKMQVGPPDKFMETMSQSRNIPPCRKFFVHGDILKDGSRRDKLLLPQFFEHVAPFVTYLEMETECHPIFRRARPEEGLEYPKLKSLKLVAEARLPLKQVERNLAAMISILEHAPNLETVSIEVIGIGANVNAVFFHLAERVPWTQIRHLTLNRKMEDKDFQRMLELMGRNLQLKTLELEVRFYVTLGKHFHMFLERQRDTLETLSLSLRMVELEPEFTFPQLPKLRTLQINLVMMPWAWVAAVGSSLKSISHQLPALQFVSLCGPSWRCLEAFLHSLDSVPVESVITLKLEAWGDYEFENGQEAGVDGPIRKICKIFPRVRNLTVPANHTVLKAIDTEKAWKDVEELKLVCGHHGTAKSALAGPPLVIRIMGPGGGIFRTQETDTEIKILQFLKQVKVLKLQHVKNAMTKVTGPACLTDTVCHSVLLKLENLQCLDLYDHMPHQVSEPVIQQMQEKFRVLQKKSKKTRS